MLERLTEIRPAIEVREAEGVESVRAALTRTFKRFVLHRAGSPAAPARFHAELALLGDGGLVIGPVIREQAIEGYSESLAPSCAANRLSKPKTKNARPSAID